MLSLFPQLFDFGPLAITVLRVGVAVIFLWESYLALQKNKKGILEKVSGQKRPWCKIIIGIAAATGGILLFVGLFTQVAALALTAVAAAKGILKRKENPSQTLPYYILLGVVAFSFLFLGPGIWSLDYPL